MASLSYIACITLHCNFKMCFATTVLNDRSVYKILYFIVGEVMQYCYSLLMLWIALVCYPTCSFMYCVERFIKARITMNCSLTYRSANCYLFAAETANLLHPLQIIALGQRLLRMKAKVAAWTCGASPPKILSNASVPSIVYIAMQDPYYCNKHPLLATAGLLASFATAGFAKISTADIPTVPYEKRNSRLPVANTWSIGDHHTSHDKAVPNSPPACTAAVWV